MKDPGTIVNKSPAQISIINDDQFALASNDYGENRKLIDDLMTQYIELITRSRESVDIYLSFAERDTKIDGQKRFTSPNMTLALQQNLIQDLQTEIQWQKDMIELKDKLAKITFDFNLPEMTMVKTISDGNCLFDALRITVGNAYPQKYGGLTNAKIRAQLVKHVREQLPLGTERSKDYQMLLVTNVHDLYPDSLLDDMDYETLKELWLAKMQKNGIFGDSLITFAASDYFNVRIIVAVTGRVNPDVIEPKNNDGSLKPNAHTIVLCNFENKHFIACVPKSSS